MFIYIFNWECYFVKLFNFFVSLLKFSVFVYVFQDRVNVSLVGAVWVTACISGYINWSHRDAGFES